MPEMTQAQLQELVAKQAAEALGIPVRQPERLGDEFDPEVDTLVAVAYGQRKIGFMRSLCRLQFGKGGGIGFKPHHAAGPGLQQGRHFLFAQATGDHQWIHVDVERARTGPFGAPIAHGFLTLSLLPTFFASAMSIRQAGMGINYGLNKVRFTSPVPVGSRLRARMALKACDPLEGQGVQLTWTVTVEREGSDRPACVAESIARWYP